MVSLSNIQNRNSGLIHGSVCLVFSPFGPRSRLSTPLCYYLRLCFPPTLFPRTGPAVDFPSIKSSLAPHLKTTTNLYGNSRLIWWKFICFIHGARGPFSKPGKMGKIKKLYFLGCKLFPEGPPIHSEPWIVSSLGPVDEFVSLIEGLFKKNEISANRLAWEWYVYMVWILL